MKKLQKAFMISKIKHNFYHLFPHTRNPLVRNLSEIGAVLSNLSKAFDSMFYALLAAELYVYGFNRDTPVDTGRKLNVLCTFSLRPVSAGTVYLLILEKQEAMCQNKWYSKLPWRSNFRCLSKINTKSHFI